MMENSTAQTDFRDKHQGAAVMPECPACGSNEDVRPAANISYGSHFCWSPGNGCVWFTPAPEPEVKPNCPKCGSNRKVSLSVFNPERGTHFCCDFSCVGLWFTPAPVAPATPAAIPDGYWERSANDWRGIAEGWELLYKNEKARAEAAEAKLANSYFGSAGR